MSERSPAASILGAAVVVALSGAAAYFGARMARQDAEPAAPDEERRPAVEDSATADARDRRIGYLEKRVELLEDGVRTLTAMKTAADERVGGATTAPAPSAPDALKPRAADPEAPRAAPFDPSDRDAVVARMTEAYRVMQRNRVVGQMAAYADPSRDAAANRVAQARADALALMAVLEVRGDDVRDQLVKIFTERLDSAARDIGPIVRDGLERTDIATVRARLKDLDAETDKKLRALFDETTWKRYEPNAQAARQSTEAVLDEFEKARLGGR
jgi:hypothetical protein